MTIDIRKDKRNKKLAVVADAIVQQRRNLNMSSTFDKQQRYRKKKYKEQKIFKVPRNSLGNILTLEEKEKRGESTHIQELKKLATNVKDTVKEKVEETLKKKEEEKEPEIIESYSSEEESNELDEDNEEENHSDVNHSDHSCSMSKESIHDLENEEAVEISYDEVNPETAKQ